MREPGGDNAVEGNAHVSGIHRLAQAAAGSVDPEGIVAAAWAELPVMVDADAVGLALFQSKQVWTWSKPGEGKRAEILQSRLLSRFERGSEWKVGTSKSPRSLRRTHLSLVPKSNAFARPDDTAGSIHEIPLAVGLEKIGLLRVERAARNPFTEQEQHALSAGAVLLGLAFGHLQAKQALQDIALQDSLTGVLARRALYGPLQRELKVGLRYGTPASLLVMDLDHFTTVNDRLGHDAGDDVLKAIATLVQENVRAVDCVGRYGGEQFAVVLPYTDVEMAQTMAERIRADIERHAFDVVDGQVRITVSVGVASLHDASSTTVDGWMAAAGAALAEAKAQGRNRVATHHACNPAPAQAGVLRVA
jgi:diguanylate cyclase (GGDEF)-like protein